MAATSTGSLAWICSLSPNPRPERPFAAAALAAIALIAAVLFGACGYPGVSVGQGLVFLVFGMVALYQGAAYELALEDWRAELFHAMALERIEDIKRGRG